MGDQIKAAVMGCGHIGTFAAEAVILAPDMELVGVVDLCETLPEVKRRFSQVPAAERIEDLPEKPDVAILGLPTRAVEKVAPCLLLQGINTVDCFDMHGDPFMRLRETLGAAASAGGATAVMCSGVDPGVSTMVRALFEIWAPTGLTHVTYGPGMSMGHTVAAKSYPGVRDALSITRPGDPGFHKREVYLEIEPGYEFEEVKSRILADPYFSHDDVRVFQVDDVTPLVDMGHRINVFRKGGASGVDNQLLEFETTFHNPASTAQVMVAAARATTRLSPGAYSMLEVPLVSFFAGEKEALLKRLV